jgi:hypothetical protein
MEDKATPHETYMAYMLRLWQVGSREGRSVWCASLENPHTGERQAFGDVEALVAFLADRISSPIDAKNILDTIENATSQEERTVP